MAEAYLRQSALAHLGLAARAVADQEKAGQGGMDAGVWIGECAFRGQINLRGNPSRRAFTDAVKDVIGCALPTKPNTSAGPDDLNDGPRALWLGPDEWLLVTTAGAEADLASALAGIAGAAVTDVSDGRTVISLSGRHARDVLMKGCPLDLHPSVFEPGHCAQSLLVRAAVILYRGADDAAAGGAAFEIHVARSFAEYLWMWLEDAASEYGLRVVEA